MIEIYKQSKSLGTKEVVVANVVLPRSVKNLQKNFHDEFMNFFAVDGRFHFLHLEELP
jgi:hypothetical protein